MKANGMTIHMTPITIIMPAMHLKIIFGTIYFSLVSVVLAASPANLLPNISVSSNAIFQQDYST